jgi:hypothetical protein
MWSSVKICASRKPVNTVQNWRPMMKRLMLSGLLRSCGGESEERRGEERQGTTQHNNTKQHKTTQHNTTQHNIAKHRNTHTLCIL